MSLKKVLCGALALPMIFVGGALAKSGDASVSHRAAMQQQAAHFAVQQQPAEAPVVVAQQNAPLVNNLEERLRDLNGKVEELNFQVLQMQDQIRKMQQDNEFRFQQLEGNGPSGGGGGDGQSAPPKKQGSLAPPGVDMGSPLPQQARQDESAPAATATSSGEPQLGAPPTTFGTITFDANGNVVGGTANPNVDNGSAAGQGSGRNSGAAQGSAVAALPPADSADELYRNSYQFILSGEYKTAEAGFRKHIDKFPNDPRAADAHFWLGEALLGEDRYRDAAEVFLKANRKYPNAKKAPDMLLKLGISLAAMNQRDVACATYGEIGQRYPDISAALKQRVKQEEQLAGC